VANLCDVAGFDTFYYDVPQIADATILFDEPSLVCMNSELVFSLSGIWNNVLWQNSFVGPSYTAVPGVFGPWEVTVQAIAPNGCPSSDTVVVNVQDCFLGQLQNDVDFLVYPNPFQNTLHVAAEFNINQLEVYDVTGKLVHTNAIDASDFMLNLEFLENGIYHIFFWNEEGNIYHTTLVKLNP
jgi:hypothetical protein